MAQSFYPLASPQSIGQTMDTAFHIFRLSLARCLPHGVLSMIAGQIANIYYLASGRPIGRFGGGDPVWWTLYVVGALASLLLWSAMLLRQRNILEGQPQRAMQELGRASGRLPALVGLLIAGALAIAVGLLALVIPGIYLAIALIPTWPILVLEGLGPSAAIRRSLHLVKGHWWRTGVILTITTIVAIVFYFAVFVLMAMVLPLFGANDVAMFTAASAVVAIVLGAVGVPFYGAVIIALYGDLKIRKAGTDLEQRLLATAQG